MCQIGELEIKIENQVIGLMSHIGELKLKIEEPIDSRMFSQFLTSEWKEVDCRKWKFHHEFHSNLV